MTTGIAKCKYCSGENYLIHHLYTGYRQQLFIVECGDCKGQIIPVVVDRFIPEMEFYSECKTAWNGVNEVPNANTEKAMKAENA